MHYGCSYISDICWNMYVAAMYIGVAALSLAIVAMCMLVSCNMHVICSNTQSVALRYSQLQQRTKKYIKKISCLSRKISIVKINNTLHIALTNMLRNDQHFLFMLACCLWV